MQPPSAPDRRAPLRRRPRALSALVVCLGALAPAAVADPAGAASGAPDDRTLQRRLEAFVDGPGGPPGAIAVLRRDGRTQVVRAGVADIGTGRAPRTTDHMRLASTAKAFSGAVALSLVDRHRLRLDDTLRRRLPGSPSAWGKVTLRQLLNHTSGLPDYLDSPVFQAQVRADPHRRFAPHRLLDYVAGRPLLFGPGSRYHYSNSDNIAVALMAEAATRTPYEKLLRTLVYRPLGLRDTSLPQGYRLPVPYLHGYDISPPGPPVDVSELLSASGAWASGGIVSTLADATRFVRGYAGGALYGRKVLREQRRWRPGASQPAGPGRNSTGLGIFRYRTRCGVVLGHTGNFPGYTQLMAATPDGRRSLTFSVTRQINADLTPALLARMRALQEDFVCGLLRGRG